MAYYEGPKTDHFNGKTFFNPSQKKRPSFKDFLKWQKIRKKGPWPKQVAIRHDVPPLKVEGADLRVSFIGQATFLIQTAGLNILTDPFYSNRAGPFGLLGPKRVSSPGIHFEDLPPIDVVLVSHNHYDHMDLKTLKKLHHKYNPLIITPLGNDVIMRQKIKNADMVALDWRQHHDWGGLSFHLMPAYHWSSRTPFDRRRALWGAFVIETPHGPLYFAGDTGFGEGVHFSEVQQKFLRFRLAMLPIGAYEPRWFMRESHMNPMEAFEAHKLLNAQTSLAMHFETIQLTDEDFAMPREAALKLLEQNPTSHFIVPKIGEHVMVD